MKFFTFSFTPASSKLVQIGPKLVKNWTRFTGGGRRFSNEDLLEDTWLKLERPIATWQPLLAAILWFTTAMNILYPVSLIAQATPTPSSFVTDNANSFSSSRLYVHNDEYQTYISSNKPYLYDYNFRDTGDSHTPNLGEHWTIENRTINIDTDYAHLQVGAIFFAYEVCSLWTVHKMLRPPFFS